MKPPLIINLDTSNSPLTRLRDGVLALLCWVMWASLLVSVANGTGAAPISGMYLTLVGLLTVAFLVWSGLRYSLAPLRSPMTSVPLTLAKLANHFELKTDLISGMQTEKQVLLFHSPTGSVTHVRRKYRMSNSYDSLTDLRQAA